MKLNLEKILKKGLFISLFAIAGFTSDFHYEKLVFYEGIGRRYRFIEMLRNYGEAIKTRPKRWILGFEPDLFVFGKPKYDGNIRKGDLKKVLGEIKKGNYDTLRINNKLYYITSAKRRLIERGEGKYTYKYFPSMDLFYYFINKNEVKYTLGILPHLPLLIELEDFLPPLEVEYWYDGLPPDVKKHGLVSLSSRCSANNNSKVLNLDHRYHYNKRDLEKFNNWVTETLEESKRDSTYAIIVDKSKYLLYLIKKGEVHSKYWIELGTNPFDDKKRRGDRCTPEGRYYITRKKEHSIFYKALLLSYPSIEDAKEGLERRLINKKTFNEIANAILNKKIPNQNTRLGGLIEIHGHGSGWPGNKGGYNWTWGCIAIPNYAMDRIFPLVKDGIKDGEEATKVTIVKYTTVLN